MPITHKETSDGPVGCNAGHGKLEKFVSKPLARTSLDLQVLHSVALSQMGLTDVKLYFIKTFLLSWLF